jgi:tetratricopeptide (TPR) repeat protein
VTAPAATPSDEQRRKARGLAQTGRQAAILGDSSTALTQLREASMLDPTDAELAYELARAYETAGAGGSAAKEYCRFITIAPNAPEANEARNRITTLAPPAPDPSSSIAKALFLAAVASYERGQMTDAGAKFTAAINAEPTWADAYYDRALVRGALQDQARAMSDFEEYLRLKPQASDRAQVLARVDELRRRPPSPGEALGLGLILPGGGQFYTGRPIRGAIFLAGASAALGFALQTHTTLTTVQQTATDPFGNPYTFTTTVPKTDHPNLVPGIAIAGAIGVGSAIEAFLYARQASNDVRRVSVIAIPTTQGFAAGLELRFH